VHDFLITVSGQLFEQPFPFGDLSDDDLLSELPSVPRSVEPLLKTSSLRETPVYLLDNRVFMDRVLPSPTISPSQNCEYSLDYFVTLHKLVAANGPCWPEFTPNHLGARIPLRHSNLKVDRWRHHLIGYENVEICQYLEFGFPLGLTADQRPMLKSTYRNHGSAY
jgi:hypothetical protein